MLSTPPAFNLSQNQTLQFKSVAKISVGRKSESQSSFPFAIHLSMNHTDSLGAKQLFTPLRFRCQQVFSFSRKFFSRPRRGNSLARGRLMSHFQTRVKNFFAIRENFFSRRPFGRGQLVGANGFMRLFNSIVKHFSAKNRKKCFRTVKKALPRRAALFFNQLFVTVRLPPEKVKRFMTFFIQYVYSTDKSNKNIMIWHKSQPPANNRKAAVTSRTVRKKLLQAVRDAPQQP